MANYHKLPTGEWVAIGTKDEIKVGPILLSKRSGKSCPRVIDEVGIDCHGHRVGYLTEHCKDSSREARLLRRSQK